MNSPQSLPLYSVPDLPAALTLLGRLPLANTAMAHEDLLRLLDSIQANPLSAMDTLTLLEHIRVPLAFVQEELSKRFLDKALPLAENEQKAFNDVVTGWQKMGRTYALAARLDSGGDPEHPRRVALVLARCLHYFGLAMMEHFRAHRELPAGMWLELHGYYGSADEWGVANLAVAEPLDSIQQSTHCSAAYVTMLLLDAAGPYSLTSREFNLVRRLATRWAPLVAIRNLQGGERPGKFCIDPMQDAGLRPVPDNAEDDAGTNFLGCLDLNTETLTAQLQQTAQQLSQRVSPSQLGLGNEFTARRALEVIRRVARPWSQAPSPRRFRRRKASGVAHLAIGMEAIHYFVGGKLFAQPGVLRTYSRQEFEAMYVFRHQVDPNADLHIIATQVEYSTEEWEVLNHSAGGFRLRRRAAGNRLGHGQLMAVKPHDGDRFLLAQASWLMEERDGTLVVGLNVLPGTPVAISARLCDEKHPQFSSSYSRAFMLPELEAIKAPASLVLPGGWHAPQAEVEIYLEEPRRVQVGKMLESGPDFDRMLYKTDYTPGAKS